MSATHSFILFRLQLKYLGGASVGISLDDRILEREQRITDVPFT